MGDTAEGRGFVGIEGRVALVTGAAGGIGLAAVRRLAREGARVLALDLEGSDLASAVAAAAEAGGEAVALAGDVTRAADWQRAFEEADRRFGGVDFLFNNAGVEGVVAPIESYPEDVFQRVLAVNVQGVFLGIKHAIPALRARGGGAIVNTSSVAGVSGDPNVCAYVASKHAVVGLTRAAALSGGPDGIRVNAICPAMVETRMMRSLESGLGADHADEVKKLLESRIPLGRYGTPEEVAALAVFLFSDDARFVNGSLYTLDGGYTAT